MDTSSANRRPFRRGRALAIAASLLIAGIACGGMARLPIPLHKANPDVLRATLDNGLRVVIVRNTLAPVVSTSMDYLVGSDEAPRGFPGMAHAQEHMMFRGAPGLSADQLADIGSLMGGDFNADTQESVTQYFFTVPAEDLDVALHIAAARMKGVTDSEKDWKLERGAIEQEVARDFSDPGYVLYTKLRAHMFAGTPYEHDALGSKPSFDKTTADMLKAFHNKWYAPNNAIFFVVGDLDPKATLVKIKDVFSDIKRKHLPKRPEVNLQPVAQKRIEMKTDRPVGTEMIAMRVPGMDSKDFPALEVLADVLSSQRGDLYALVPEGKAVSADFDLDPLPKAGLAYATVSFPKGADPKALDTEVRKILANYAKNGVPADLVAAAKRQEKSATEFQKNSISGLASVWAEAVAVYGLKSPEEDLQRIEKVSVADVDRVAKKYIDLDHAVTAVMMPEGGGKPTRVSGGFGGQENIALGEAAPTKLPEWAETTLSHLKVPPWTLKPVVTTLPNGITLIVQPEDVSDTVSVYGHIKTRADMESPKGQDGVAGILGQLFNFGSEHLNRLAYQAALDKIGAQETAGTDFGVAVLADDFDRGVQLLADNELHPALPAPAFKIIQAQSAAVVAARLQSPGYRTSRSLRKALFPKTDPTLREATPKTIKSLTLADVKAYYKHAYRPDMTTIAVIGKVTPEEAKATIEKYFGAWTATGPKPDTDLPPAPRNKASTVAVPDPSRVQDTVTLAETMPLKRSNNDFYAVDLGDAVLGGGFYSTRLSIDLRKNSGLVYSVGSGLETGKTRSVYYVAYACDPKNVSKAARLVANEIKKMQDSPASADEIARAKALLLRRIPLNNASVSAIASGFFSRRDLDLPLDEPAIAAQHFIALDAGQVQAAFKKWIRADGLVRVSQGPTPH